ncbi:MAG: O-antigen ligase family protein [Armatimonadota bacterium]
MGTSVGLVALIAARRWVFPTALRNLALLWFALALTYILRLTPGLASVGLKTTFQLVTVIALVICASSVRWDIRALTAFSKCSIVASGWSAVAYLFARHHWGPFREINMNMVGVWGFLAFGLCVLSAHICAQPSWRLLSIAGAVLSVATTFLSGSRAAIVGIIVYLFVYPSWSILSRRRYLPHLCFALMVGLLVFVPWLFTEGGLTAMRFRELQFLMWEVFDKNLNTRADIWSYVVDVFLESPWIGHGTGFWPFRGEVAIQLSCHNSYLNIAVQTGVVGAGIFILILWTIWNIYVKNQSTTEMRPFAAFLVGLVMLRLFETGMTEVDLASGYVEWTIVSMGISCAICGVLRPIRKRVPARKSKYLSSIAGFRRAPVRR